MKTTNPILKGLKGTFGDMVFYELNGETIARRRPVRRKPLTSAQIENQMRQREAILYGKQMQMDPAYIAASERNKKKFPNPYTAAVADYRTTPQLVGAIMVPGETDTLQFIIDGVTVQDVQVVLAPVAEHGTFPAALDSGTGGWRWDRAATLGGLAVSVGQFVVASVVIRNLPGKTSVFDPNVEPRIIPLLETQAE